MSVSTNMSIFSSLYLTKMVEETGQNAQKNEVVTRLVTNLLSRAAKAFIKKDFKALDPNAADHLCELRAIILYILSKREDVYAEANALLTQKDLSTISLSDDLLFIIRCYLLNVTRVQNPPLENGIVRTKMEMSRISTLAKKVALFNKASRQYFVFNNAQGLNLQSISKIQGIAACLDDPSIREGLEEVKEVENPPFLSKFTCSLFFQVKAILECLKKKEGIIAIKSIETVRSPVHFFLKASKEGFTIISKKEMKPSDALIVFEAVLDREVLEKELVDTGFEALLCKASLGEKIPYFLLHHVYCSSLNNEGVSNV